MSLVAQALCVVAQNLVMGRTWAGDDVLLQPVYPIDEVMREGREPAPVVAVYSEHSKANVEGRATQGRSNSVDLKFFVYNAPGTNRVVIDGSEVLEVDLDTNNAGITLNVVARQIDAALHTMVPLWSECWRKMVVKVDDRDIRYVLIEIENGVKIPAAEIGYSISAIPDPDFGAPLTAAWQALDAALKTTAEGTKLAKLFELLIVDPLGLPAWQQFRDNFALTDGGLAGSGLGPYQGVTLPNGDVPPFQQHTVTGETLNG